MRRTLLSGPVLQAFSPYRFEGETLAGELIAARVGVPTYVARPEGLDPPAYRFEACRSIQLSYGRVRVRLYLARRVQGATVTFT